MQQEAHPGPGIQQTRHKVAEVQDQVQALRLGQAQVSETKSVHGPHAVRQSEKKTQRNRAQTQQKVLEEIQETIPTQTQSGERSAEKGRSDSEPDLAYMRGGMETTSPMRTHEKWPNSKGGPCRNSCTTSQ